MICKIEIAKNDYANVKLTLLGEGFNQMLMFYLQNLTYSLLYIP